MKIDIMAIHIKRRPISRDAAHSNMTMKSVMLFPFITNVYYYTCYSINVECRRSKLSFYVLHVFSLVSC